MALEELGPDDEKALLLRVVECERGIERKPFLVAALFARLILGDDAVMRGDGSMLFDAPCASYDLAQSAELKGNGRV